MRHRKALLNRCGRHTGTCHVDRSVAAGLHGQVGFPLTSEPGTTGISNCGIAAFTLNDGSDFNGLPGEPLLGVEYATFTDIGFAAKAASSWSRTTSRTVSV